MDRKNITIREDQTAWIERSGVNLSQFVQERLDEAMGPTEAELAYAYEENAEEARRVNRKWQHVSDEANEQLSEPAELDPEYDS